MLIQIINEVGIDEESFATIVRGASMHVNKVVKAYGQEPVTLEPHTYFGDSSRTPLTSKAIPRVFITERKRTSALAWRDVSFGEPVVYVSKKASVKLFGVYTPPRIINGIIKSPSRIRSGLISVLAHELSELVISPTMNNFTMPDSAGKSWRKEVCDPVLGAYYSEKVDGIDCVFPDFVLPSFWDYKGVGPYSYMETAKEPMVWAKGSYAWFKTALIRLKRVQF